MRATYVSGESPPGFERRATPWNSAFRAVAADTGQIGGSGSHEFQVLAESGEDAIAWCAASDYAAIQGFVLVTATFTLFLYLAVDLIYFAIDPRIAY